MLTPERDRERLRRAAEDGERLYRIRMHDPVGPTIADDNRINGILSLELPDALGAFDRLRAALDAERAAHTRCAEAIEKAWRESLDEADRCDDEGAHVGLAMYYRNVARGLGDALQILRADPLTQAALERARGDT